MRTRRLLVAAALTATTLVGCSDDSRDVQTPDTQASRPSRNPMPTGKSDIALEQGDVLLSPEGFAPQLQLTVPSAGWTSTHRGADGFDIGQPVPGEDAALVVVAFLIPSETTATEALQQIARAGRSAGATVAGTEGVLRVRGGDGALVASRDGGIALDAVPGGSAVVRAVDYDDGPLLTVTWVPDEAHSDEAHRLADELTAQVHQV